MTAEQQHDSIIKYIKSNMPDFSEYRHKAKYARFLGFTNAKCAETFMRGETEPRLYLLFSIMGALRLAFGLVRKGSIVAVIHTHDEAVNFITNERNGKLFRSKYHHASHMVRRANVSLLTFIRAANELGYIVRIGTVKSDG